MNENSEEWRYEQLKRVLPDVFNCQSMLYVGGHFHMGRNLQMTQYFKCPIDVVEIYEPNVKDLQNSKRIRQVFYNDIRTFGASKMYEVVMWWHGPEHVPKKDLPAILLRMSQYCSKYIIFACPNGVYEQGPEYGNQYEIHASHYTVQDFIDIGMEADAIGEPNKKQGNIIAWRKML